MRGCSALAPGRSIHGSHQPHQQTNQTIMPLMEGLWLEGTQNGQKMLMGKVGTLMLPCLLKNSFGFRNAFIQVVDRFQPIGVKFTSSFCLLPKIHLSVRTSLQMKLIKLSEAFTSQQLQLPQTTRASRRFAFHLTSRLNPRPSEFWLEGSEGSVPPPLKRHDSCWDCEKYWYAKLPDC